MTAPRSPERVAAMVEARNEHAREVAASAHRFPVYELPEFVRERFPDLDLADPSTWPEPDRCTDGRPYGFDAYGVSGIANGAEDQWRRYLAALDAGPRPARARRSFVDRDKGCRNRWRYDDSRLCGTHDRPWRESIEAARRRVARNAREQEHRDLARQLAAHGIVADGYADSVRLQADAVRDLLRILDEAVRRAGGTITAGVHLIEEVTAPPSEPWPDQGPTPEPPL